MNIATWQHPNIIGQEVKVLKSVFEGRGMKIYRFNPETGVYLGEDFADETPVKRSSRVIPPDATTIAPPQVKPGEAPVFNVRTESWEVHPLSELRRKLLAKNGS